MSSADDESIPPARMDSRRRERLGMLPVFTVNRSISLAPSFAPAASPMATPQTFTMASPPARLAGFGVAHRTRWACAASRPISTRFEPVPRLRDFPLVPLVHRLISLAGPSPSGSAKPSRLCQRCFPPFLASPRLNCAQLLPGCCDNPAGRTSTSLGSRRFTAHERLVAHKPSSTGHRNTRPVPVSSA